MTNTISTADKLVKVTLGITKLLVGESRLDAAKDIMAVVTNGKALHADLIASERDIATALLARAEARFEALAGQPDFPPERLRTAKIHMEQALEHCIPEPDTLAALDLDAERITEAMIEAAIGAAPKAEFALCYASKDAELRYSRRFFAEVTAPFLAELLADAEVTEKLAPTLWRDLLGTVHDTHRMVREIFDRREATSVPIGLPLAAAQKIAAAFGAAAEDVIDMGRLETFLEGKAAEYADFKARLEASSNEDDPDIQRLRAEAAALIEAGEFDLADARLTEAETLDKSREREEEDRLIRRKHSRAKTRAERGDLARLRIAYREAADHYAAAAEIVTAGTEAYWRYQERRASVFIDLGREYGDNPALVEAIRLYREAVLPLFSRADRPDDWAGTQNNLGNALAILGKRESDTERLKEAVAAYREALKESPRGRVPLDWATTMNNLGAALQTLGGREIGTKRLLVSGAEPASEFLDDLLGR